MSAIALIIVRKLRGDDDGVPGVSDPDAGPDTEFLRLEPGEPRVVTAASDDRERTVISYGSETSEEAIGDTPGDTHVVSSYDGDPGVTSYSEAGQPWGHHGPRDTYNALLRTQGPSSGLSGHSPRVKLNPLFHQYS